MKVAALDPCRAGLLVPILAVGLIACVRGVSAPAQDAGFPIVASFSSTEIGAEAQSWTTLQDSDGILYFGCDGLVTFDGERWRESAIKDAYALRGLDFGSNGRLWAAATGEIGWFDHRSGSGWKFHSLRPMLPPTHAAVGEVWHVFAEGDGAIFVSDSKILRWTGTKFQVWPMPGARRLPAMRLGNTIYVHHPPTGLYAMGPDGPKKIISAEVLGGATVLWMENRGDGWLLATSKGLFVFAHGQIEPFGPDVSEFIRQQSLTSVARLPDGRLALGTFRGGIALASADGRLERVIGDADGLPTHAIYSLFVARGGELWVTSPSHIFRIAIASASAIFDRRSGLPAQPALSIAQTENHVVVAMDGGAYVLADDGRHFRPLNSLRERAADLQATARGLLAATNEDVRIVAEGKTTELYKTKQNAFLAQPSHHWPGSVLVSEGRNIVLVTAGGGTHVLVHDLPDIATSIAEDASGNLWLGTMTRGILTARPSLEAATTAAPPFNSPGLSAIDGWGLVRANADGAILAFARNAGWIKGPAATSFEAIGGYPRRDVAAASAIDGSGDAWIVHSASDGIPVCVARIAIHGDHATWQAHSLEGLWEIGLPRCVLAEPAPAGGTILWIGGTDGIVRNVVRSGPVAPTPQTPLLHAFARGAEHEALQPISGPLPYQTRSVVFEFAAPEYSRRPALRLQTRMDGIDEGWVAAGPKARREFTAMRDGRYDFRVRAVAETGLISGEAAFHFEIAPPWWRTFPAILGAAVLLGAATFGVYRLRVRALRRHNADLEEKVRERTEQLARASAAKTQFVANMSHDIRNPLNGIVGLALALEDTRLDGCQREIVATLRECTTYLSSLVDDVLDFASIESGRVTLRPGPFVPAELLRSVVATLRADAAQRSAVLTVDAAPGLPAMLLGDAGRIQQILVNYVTNALKYAGGEIRLSASVPPGSPGEIEFAVSDRGPGIDGAAQSILFTKFTRLPHGRESGIKGTGLGLASCRLLADVMNGSVGVESHPGHGARFFLRLPLTVGAAPPAAVNSPFAEASVLVVEDTDYNAWAAAAVLSRLGLAHVRARTGAEALSLFAERRFNVVLLDRNLPDMDGTAVARRMRGLEPDGPRAILLAVTAYCTPEDRTCCLDAGMDAFVGKPLTPEKLRKILIAAGRQLLTAASVQASADTRAPAAVDLSLLGYLSDGTEHGLDAQVDRFVTALVEADDRLAHAAAAREFGVLADAAHLVLSQAKLIGGAALEAAALALERSARDHQAPAFAGRLARVHTEIAALTEALHHRHRATHSV